MTRIASIVEGHGEVESLPVVLRRLAERDAAGGGEWPQVLRPIRVKRDRFINRADEFRRHLLLARNTAGLDGWVLILLDADDDCPAELGASLLQRAKAIVPGTSVSVVLANREFEAWFIAAAPSLTGVRGFHPRAGDEAVDAELPRDAKGWMRGRMTAGIYGEVGDQAAFASQMDLTRTFERSRSFRKLCSEWAAHASTQEIVP